LLPWKAMTTMSRYNNYYHLQCIIFCNQALDWQLYVGKNIWQNMCKGDQSKWLLQFANICGWIIVPINNMVSTYVFWFDDSCPNSSSRWISRNMWANGC
jgi:hypothetical protein